MIDAAITAEQVADELQHMPAAVIRDPLELVIRNARLARLLREAAGAFRAVSHDTRQVTPRTTKPCERRRTVQCRKGREIIVESRRHEN